MTDLLLILPKSLQNGEDTQETGEEKMTDLRMVGATPPTPYRTGKVDRKRGGASLAFSPTTIGEIPQNITSEIEIFPETQPSNVLQKPIDSSISTIHQKSKNLLVFVDHLTNGSPAADDWVTGGCGGGQVTRL